MWEDMEAECLRTIECGEIDHSFRYSRRHRWKPLDVDIDGDLAVVAVATRGKHRGGGITARRWNGGWQLDGASGGGGEDRSLPQRPEPGARWFVAWSVTGSARDRPGRWPRKTLHFHDSIILAAERVAMVERRGQRTPVGEHGFVCGVWEGRAFPGIDLLDDEGQRLDRVTERDVQELRSSLPWHVKFGMLARERSQGVGWLNDDPSRRRQHS